jgi:radical SAM protein with 4Fe4S-binding SPASM domain
MNVKFPGFLDARQQTLLEAYLSRSLTVGALPACLVIESTNRCNLECIMCPRVTMSRRTGAMDPALFRDIIDQVAFHTEFIYLHFFGEPLLNDRLFELIEYASGKGITVAMSTNATLLDMAATEAFIASKLGLLIISVDSLEGSTYERIRRGGNFTQVIRNLENFIECFARAGDSTLSVAVQMIRMTENAYDIGRFEARFRGIPGVHPVVKHLDDYAGQYANAKALGAERSGETDGRICAEPWKTLVIGFDGKVLPCHNDFDYKAVLGELTRQSIAEVWNGALMQEFRQMHIEGNQARHSLCAKCGVPDETIAHGTSMLSRFRAARSELQTYYHKGLYPFEFGGAENHLWTQREFELLLQDRFEDARLVLCNPNPAGNEITMKVDLFGEPFGECSFRDRIDFTLKTPSRYASYSATHFR